MENTISQHIEKIHRSIDWVNSSLKGEKRKLAYSKLVDCRRQLNKVKYAIADNPAAAMYGESQMGKSYLVSGLLSTPENPFNVVDQRGKKYNFIKDINPKAKTTRISEKDSSNRGGASKRNITKKGKSKQHNELEDDETEDDELGFFDESFDFLDLEWELENNE